MSKHTLEIRRLLRAQTNKEALQNLRQIISEAKDGSPVLNDHWCVYKHRDEYGYLVVQVHKLRIQNIPYIQPYIETVKTTKLEATEYAQKLAEKTGGRLDVD